MGLVTEILLRKIPNDYILKKEYLDSNSKNIQILILGSSHSTYGINPDYFSSAIFKEKSFNASNISQTIDYDYEIFKKYSNKLPNLKYIILPISYFSLYLILDSGPELWRIKNYNLYFDINKSNNIADQLEILSSELPVNLNRIYNYYHYGISHITCSKLGWREVFHEKIETDFLQSGKMAAERHSGKGENHFADNSRKLKEILRIANNMGVKVLLYTPPAYYTYTQNLDHTQLNSTLNYASELPEIFKNTRYINLLSDKSFIKEDFYDADHLNKFGAKKLTLKLEGILKEIN